MIEHRRRTALDACARDSVPVASLICFVSGISVAWNIMLFVMVSRASVELAHEGVVEAELVGEDDGRAILLQRLGPVRCIG
jgi:hypothetical protein